MSSEQSIQNIVRAGSTPSAPLKIAVVGAGKMAANHVRAISRVESGAEVVAIADTSEMALTNLGALVPDARKYPTLTALLANETVDVVHVCSPPASHASLAEQALSAGCHIYVEKPFTEKVDDAQRILMLAKDRNRIVCAGHQLLEEEPTRITATLAPSIGRIVHVESYFSFRPVRRAPGGRVPLASDLQLLDILPHPVYLLLRVLENSVPGTPELVSVVPGEAGTLHALVRQGHITATLVVTLEGRPVESYVKLVGTNGSITADYIRGTVQRDIGPGTSGIDKVLAPYRRAGQLLSGTTSALTSRVLRKQASYPGLTALIDSFYRAILKGVKSPVSPENILETTRICEVVAEGLGKRKLAQPPVHAVRDNVVLITGGTGLLGKAVAQELTRRNRAVRVLARRQPASWERLADVEYVVADLARPLDPALFDGVTQVIHAAAETAGGWEEHQRNSIDATSNLLNAGSTAGVKDVIHISSVAVLSRPSFRTPIRDDTPLAKNSRAYGPYVWGKLESERRAIELGDSLGMSVKVVRPGPIVDMKNFDPPGRLGRRMGNMFVATGSPRDRLAITSLDFAARTLVKCLERFSDVPKVVNLLDPEVPTRRSLIEHLRRTNPDLSVVWLPAVCLVPLSWTAMIAQKLLKPSRPAVNIAKAFSSPRYDTTTIATLESTLNRELSLPPVEPADVGEDSAERESYAVAS